MNRSKTDNQTESPILCIESATGVCSVAVCHSEGIIAIKESGDERAHSRLLAPYVKEVLDTAGIEAGRLAAVAVSRGPGSYTGLRIGVSMAKGLAYGAGLPLIAVDTMLSLYHSLLTGHPEYANPGSAEHFVPMIDARRMEVYHSVIDSRGIVAEAVRATVVEEGTFTSLLEAGRVVFFGNGADKCREVIRHPNAIFIDGVHPSAASMRGPALSAFSEKRFEDVAYFEPYYLKDFLATIPKKLLP